MIEFGLGSSLLFLLFFGVTDLGRVHQAAIEVDGAASAGALFGSISEANANNTEGIIAAARSDASTLGNALNVAVQKVCQDSTGGVVSCSATGARQYVQVSVSHSFRTAFQVPFLPASVNLSRTVMMRVK